MGLVWKHQLPTLVNSVAISDDGSLVAAATYYYPYPGTTKPRTDGKFGTYVFDAHGNELWRDLYEGNEGLYSVAVSENGQVVASGGLLSGGLHASNPSTPNRGLVRAFAADQTRLVDYSDLRTRVNSVDLSKDGSVLAAVTLQGQLLVFPDVQSAPAAPVFAVESGPRLDMVAVHPSGSWVVAAGRQGTVHLATIAGGAVTRTVTWKSPGRGIRFLACAIAGGDETFVVVGENTAYLFTKTSMLAAGGPRFVDHYETPDGGTSDDIRWVAISADGKMISVVQNLGHDLAGLLLLLANDNGHLTEAQPAIALEHNPNSTSMDDAGTIVTVADGHPIGTKGTFYMFRVSDGQKMLDSASDEMNWPMAISADGSAACAGSDDGTVCYFGVGTP